MKLNEIYGGNKKPISFEVFPPKTDGGNTDELISSLKKLEKFNPSLISVTYGAGGTSRERSAELVKRIKKELGTIPMPHFTCVCSTKSFIEKYIKDIESEGIENILALRGDSPDDMAESSGDFRHADELVRFIREKTNLSIGVAGYPEGHKDSKNPESDMDFLKRKIDAGASAVFTQLFFDNRFFFDFMERAEKAGVSVPVIPGILPIKSIAQLKKMTDMCGASIPEKIFHEFSIHSR